MKKGKITLVLFLLVLLVIPILGHLQVSAASQEQSTESTDVSSKSVDVMFTNDLHSHLNSFTTIVDDEEKEVGGFARLMTLINQQKEENPDTLLLDAGDFSMGTLIQTVYEDEAAELRMLGYLGFDVTTIGNHEFDYRASGLHNMLETAIQSGDQLPAFVLCNVDWDSMEMNEDQQLIKDAFDDYGVKDYVVIEKGDVKIAVLGVFGEDALSCAPTCALTFEDPVEAVKNTVAEIKANESVDMIVCVSHSGTSDTASKSEDEILAKKVPDLDLIISGHSHTLLEEPIVHGNTSIVSAGEYGEQVGSFSMVQNEDGRWSVENYELIPVTSEIEADMDTQEKIDGFMESVDQNYLAQFGYTKDQILATNDVEFCSLKALQEEHTELNLGDIMADAYLYAAEHADDPETAQLKISAIPSGTVRDTYLTGNLTVEDVFNSFSLGIGPDGVPGYPLIRVYFTGEELKALAEVDATISDYMPTARLYMSGLNFTYNPNRILLNKVTDICLEAQDGTLEEIEDDQLYPVIADLYSGQMLGSISTMSYGLISIVPKYADGTAIEDYEDVILTQDGKELKAWQAIAEYMQSFEDTDGDGIANVPDYYETTHGRKEVDNSTDIVSRFSNLNKYAALIIGTILLIIVIVIAIVLIVTHLIKKIRHKFVAKHQMIN